MTRLAHILISDEVKRPAMWFYCGDYLRDMGLSACSLAAQGIWVRMLCVMHDCRPYGILSLGGKEIPPRVLARMVGATPEETSALLTELEEAGVFSRTQDGLIYSRRMVRDESTRSKRAAGGSESLKNPKVPRPKAPSSKDPHQGHPPAHPREGSSPGSHSVAMAVSVSLADSSSMSGSSSHEAGFPEGAGIETAAAAAVDKPVEEELPGNLRKRLETLGIAEETAQGLANQVGGWSQLRFALDRLAEKQSTGDVHSASGLLMRRARELAEEGRGLFESRLRSLESEAPDAFLDRRWKQLPLECRSTTVVATAWVTWWKVQRQRKDHPVDQNLDLIQAEAKAWRSVLDSATECHPDQDGVRTRVERAVENVPRKSDGDLVYIRACQHALAKELGLVGTSVSEVAS